MSCPFSTNHPICLSPPPCPPYPLPQHIYEVYSRNPTSLLEEQIEAARRRVTQLQLKIQQETGGLVVSDSRQSSRMGTLQAAGVELVRKRGQKLPESCQDPRLS